MSNTPATPLSLAANAHFRQAFFLLVENFKEIQYIIDNSTRQASDRKVKPAGLLFLWRSSIAVVVEFSSFMCYSINNAPATPLAVRSSATGQVFFRHVDNCIALCYTIFNKAATPLAARLCAFWAAIVFYSLKGNLV